MIEQTAPGTKIRRGIDIPMALAAGLIVSAGDYTYTLTDKAYALGKELGVDRDEITRKKNEAEAIKKTVQDSYSELPGFNFNVSIPVIVESVRVHKYNDTTTGEEATEFEVAYDQKAMEEAITKALQEYYVANVPEMGEVSIAGGSSASVGFQRVFKTALYQKLLNKKYSSGR